MDDLVAGGILVVVILFTAAAVLLVAIAQVILWELSAIADGDSAFILASFGILVVLCALYFGTGHWLRRIGLI